MVKMDYNERFLALRDVKRTVCQALEDKFAALQRINSSLKIDEKVECPTMRPEEEPEKRDVVTDADIEAYLEEEALQASKGVGGLTGPGRVQGAGNQSHKRPGEGFVRANQASARGVLRGSRGSHSCSVYSNTA
jgi:hypothetical protein